MRRKSARSESRPAPGRLRAVLTTLAPIPAEEWRRFEQRLDLRRVPRGAALLAQGDPVDWLGFLESGLVRIHHRSGEREVTLGFDCEGRFVGAYDAFVLRGPSPIGLEALEPCLLWRFERERLTELEGGHPAWRELFRRIAERELVRRTDKELRIRTRSPEERYAELVRRGSYLLRRVPQYHLASFLGIAPETLSRIRARMTAVRGS